MNESRPSPTTRITSEASTPTDASLLRGGGI